MIRYTQKSRNVYMKDNIVRNVLIIAVISVGIAISIGFSFAYFNAKIIGNEDAKLMTINAGTIELTFVDNNTINLPNAKPGDKESKTFSIENTGTLDNEYNYNIKLVDVNTNIIKRDLKYILEECSNDECTTLKDNGIKQEGYINTDSVNNKEMYLAVDIPRPEKGEKQYYKLTIDFQELNINQNYNKDASFTGKINVDSEKGMEIYKQEANKPELYQGMIPVYFKEGKIYIADLSKDNWYDYDNNEWGNAILIDYQNNKDKFYDGDTLKVGEEVKEEDILQMYVWIPRYRYKLFNVDNKGVPKQIIEIEFEKGTETTGNVSCKYINNNDGTITEDCKNAQNGNWYTHPAFTFGSTELKGFWVGKFEPSDPTDENGRANNVINEITILPNKTSMVLKSIKTISDAERNIELQKAAKYNLNTTEIDTHMMKNMEWGAVAYLTQSIYGIYKDEKTCNIDEMSFEDCEVWINNTTQGAADTGKSNNYGGTYTGCVGTSVSAAVEWNKNDDGSPAVCPDGRQWNQSGVKASTTGNMYGVYDMSGGAWEYVMGAVVNQTGGGLYIASSGFQTSVLPEYKYYDIYTFNDKESTHERGHLGDATREILNNNKIGWNEDGSHFPFVNSKDIDPWFTRGGVYATGSGRTGVFAFGWYFGGAAVNKSFRSVLSAA